MTYNKEKEIQEAIVAAENALDHLQKAKNLLDSAKNWGYFDMFGGGFIATAFKHGKLNSAEEELKNTRYAIQSLKSELNDVNINSSIQILSDDFLTFADYFFDGIIADYLVQEKINSALTQVHSGISQVEEIIKNLKSQL